MAKRKPSHTLAEMEKKLGYKVDPMTYADEGVKRFYSDLRPVPNNVYERTKKDFKEYEKQSHRDDYKTISENVLPKLGVPLRIVHGRDTVLLTHRSHSGLYCFAVDIHYEFGFDLPLLFTNNEAYRTMTAANAGISQKLSRNEQLRPNSVTSMFFELLPKEIRHKIYIFALPEGNWRIGDDENSDNLIFAGGVGDPSGFYFPLGNERNVLRVNRQMRQEALPFVYRKMLLHLDDMDDLIKFLIAIGEIGRNNIESLELAWESTADSECKWDKAPDFEGHWVTLPTLHVVRCVQLLKQCKILRFLRLYFESDLISNISPDVFKTDRGIRELCSVRGIERAEIWSLGDEPLEEIGLAKWLKEEMESSLGEGSDEKGLVQQNYNQ